MEDETYSAKMRYRHITKNIWKTTTRDTNFEAKSCEKLDSPPQILEEQHLKIGIQPGVDSYGLCAKIDIPRNTFIGEYTGEILEEEIAFDRENNHYQFEFGEGVVLDAKFFGSLMRFLNHSCSPNAAYDYYIWDDEMHILVKSIKNIKANQWITTDYGMENGEGFNGFDECKCLSKNCKSRKKQ